MRHRPRDIANERAVALTVRLRSARLRDRGGERRVRVLVQRVELHLAPRDLAVLADHVHGAVGHRAAGATRTVERRGVELRIGDEGKGELHLRRPRDVARDVVDRDGEHHDVLPENRRVLITELRQLGRAAAAAVLRIEGEHDDLALEPGELHRRGAGAGGVGPAGGEVGRDLTDVRAVDDDRRRGVGALGTSRCGSREQRQRGESMERGERTHLSSSMRCSGIRRIRPTSITGSRASCNPNDGDCVPGRPANGLPTWRAGSTGGGPPSGAPASLIKRGGPQFDTPAYNSPTVDSAHLVAIHTILPAYIRIRPAARDEDHDRILHGLKL
jgi:hypothetical protein